MFMSQIFKAPIITKEKEEKPMPRPKPQPLIS
jgi:hypothetical protein